VLLLLSEISVEPEVQTLADVVDMIFGDMAEPFYTCSSWAELREELREFSKSVDPRHLRRPLPVDYGLTDGEVLEIRNLMATSREKIFEGGVEGVIGTVVAIIHAPISVPLLGGILWDKYQAKKRLKSSGLDQRIEAFERFTNDFKRYALCLDTLFWNTEQTWLRLRADRLEREVACLFRKEGLKAKRVGQVGDGGVDLIVSSDEGEVLVQCKGFKQPAGVGVMRSYRISSGTPPQHWKAASCIRGSVPSL
jgi:hypothetical protein